MWYEEVKLSIYEYMYMYMKTWSWNLKICSYWNTGIPMPWTISWLLVKTGQSENAEYVIREPENLIVGYSPNTAYVQ